MPDTLELLQPRMIAFPTPKTEKQQLKMVAEAFEKLQQPAEQAPLPKQARRGRHRPELATEHSLTALAAAGLVAGAAPVTQALDTFADNFSTTLAANTSVGATSFTPALTTGNPGANPSDPNFPTQFAVVIQSANYPLSGTRDVVTVTDSRTTPWQCSAIPHAYFTGDTVAAVVGGAALNSISGRAAQSVQLVKPITASTYTGIGLQNNICLDVTLDANWSVGAISGIPAGRFTIRLRLKQDATGNRTVTLPPGTVWPGHPSSQGLSTAGNSVDLINLETWDQGTTWYAYYVSRNSRLGDEQHGNLTTANFVSGLSTGTVVFPRAFVTTPDIFFTTSAITGNTPVACNCTGVSTTSFVYKAFPSAGGTFAGSGVNLWWRAIA